MDVQQICAVLQGCLSQNRDERTQAEALLKQVRALLHAGAAGQGAAAGLTDTFSAVLPSCYHIQTA